MEHMGIDLGSKESQECVRNGVGETLHMNLLPDERPVWRLKVHEDGASTLHPSVNRLKGCRAHFWFRNGRVYWCADQRQTLLNDVRLLLGLGRAS